VSSPMSAFIIVAVALGGAAGSVVRLLIGVTIQSRFGVAFPFGTLLINVTGSILVGFLIRLAVETGAVPPGARALLTTGFCGGYTTFSTFSFEVAELIEQGSMGWAATYVLASVVLSIAGTFLGFAGAHGVARLGRSR
jgi:fluoride exporter